MKTSNYNPSNYLIKTLLEQNDPLNSTLGLRTGLHSLDAIITGLKPGMLYFIGGRPGMGVSALVYNIINYITIRGETPVCIFSFKEVSWTIINSLIATGAELETDILREKKYDQIQLGIIRDFIEKLKQLPIFIDADDYISVAELRQRAILLSFEHGVKLIVIDGIDNWENHQIAALKSLAVDMNIPVIITATVGRNVDKRKNDKNPRLSDLREIGVIEKFIDVVMFIYRPEYYGIVEDEDGISTSGLMEVIIEKNRLGSIDTIPLQFIGKYGKVKTWNGQQVDI